MNGVRTTTALYVYDAAGDLPEEFRPAAESETKYGTADALGSTPGTLTYCYDYDPLGEEIAAGATVTVASGAY